MDSLEYHEKDSLTLFALIPVVSKTDDAGQGDEFEPARNHADAFGKHTDLQSKILYRQQVCDRLKTHLKENPNALKFLMIEKQGAHTFPPTKIYLGETLYQALKRIMEEDLGVGENGYFPERELAKSDRFGEDLFFDGETRREKAGVERRTKKWFLYPVLMSLNSEGWNSLKETLERKSGLMARWLSLYEIIADSSIEGNVKAVAKHLSAEMDKIEGLIVEMQLGPTMDALACKWMDDQRGGVRVVAKSKIDEILKAGKRAFNLRVADPYLPYHKQGLGFAWSFFTPMDKQDIHVHGIPAVEIYGVIEGEMQVWHKDLNSRGVLAWKYSDLGPGDWMEVSPLQCHFAFWKTKNGLGTVVKAAGTGELAGVGRIGERGKTTCEQCSARDNCLIPPNLKELVNIHGKPIDQRDYERIGELASNIETAFKYFSPDE